MLHRMQGFEYEFPDLGDPVFAISSVVEGGGRIQAAAFLKIEAEAYFFLNPGYANPLARWQMLLQLHEDVRREATDLGLSEVSCVIPPNLSRAFHRRLVKLGWRDEPEDWKRKTYHLRKVTL
jgi:hypothetical protein